MILWLNFGIVMIIFLEEMLWNFDKLVFVCKDLVMYLEKSINFVVVIFYECNFFFNVCFFVGCFYGFFV